MRRKQPEELDPGAPPPKRSRFERFIRTFWWLHSVWALVFGIGVMLYARKGLAHADKLLLVLAGSWFAMFFALRVTVGPDNVSPDDKLHKKGLRLATNYIIKNLYQQMLFFLVPLYASSTTWSFHSQNWWLAPVLLVFAVLSTMDLVMDNFVMQKRFLASVMYGVCMFGVLNLMLPLVVGMNHFTALLVSAAATAPSVALLTFRVRTVFSPRGMLYTVAATGLLTLGSLYAAPYVPPAPLAMSDGGVSHGTAGSYEEVPGHKELIPADKLDGLRCVTRLTQPGKLNDAIQHVWRRDDGTVIKPPTRQVPSNERGMVFRSELVRPPKNPVGKWECRVETADGQLIGRRGFKIVE